KPGFTSSNTDQVKRCKIQQESINRTVISKHSKVLFVPNVEKESVKDVVKKFLLDIINLELAVRLGWIYDEWNGAPIKELLSPVELKRYEEGTLEWGSLSIESIINGTEVYKKNEKFKVRKRNMAGSRKQRSRKKY
ncbi:hypothetical protein COOONC_27092, partial [Cooperia oncophora]